MPLDPDSFRSVLGRFATGVTIVTATDEDGTDHGMTVSAFCAVSLEPPLVLVCIDHAASMYDVLRVGSRYAVNILAISQEALSRRFADREQLHRRFEGIGYGRGASGAPLLDDALAHIECRVTAVHPAGDHTIFVAEVESATAFAARPLLYYRGGYAQLER